MRSAFRAFAGFLSTRFAHVSWNVSAEAADCARKCTALFLVCHGCGNNAGARGSKSQPVIGWLGVSGGPHPK